MLPSKKFTNLFNESCYDLLLFVDGHYGPCFVKRRLAIIELWWIENIDWVINI